MRKMNFLIIDDDINFTLELEKRILNKYNDAKCDRFFTKPTLSELKDDYTVIIINIYIGKDNGIEIAKELKKSFPRSFIVFASQYSQQIFFTQMVKPLCFIRKSHLDHDFKIFIYLLSKEKIEGEKLFFQLDNSFSDERNTIVSINSEDIVYIECYLHNIIINTLKKQYVVNLSLKEFMKMVKDYQYFIQIHRSYAINMKYIHQIKGSKIQMIDECAKNEVTLCLRYKNKFIDAFKESLLNHGSMY